MMFECSGLVQQSPCEGAVKSCSCILALCPVGLANKQKMSLVVFIV